MVIASQETSFAFNLGLVLVLVLVSWDLSLWREMRTKAIYSLLRYPLLNQSKSTVRYEKGKTLVHGATEGAGRENQNNLANTY